MESIRASNNDSEERMLSRRTMIAGSVATGVAVLGQQASASQSAPGTPEATSQATPAASPVSSGDIDPAMVMMLSANLCGGARLNENHVGALIELLSSEESIESPLQELAEIEWFTDETLADTSPEAQGVAANILQYWFLGRFNGEPVHNRAELYFDLASWQTLPYLTQQSSCKSFGYWAQEIEL